MKREELKKIILEQIARVTGLGRAEFEERDSLKEACGLDSLSLVALVVGAEQALGVEFDDSDLDPDALRSVGDLVDLAEKYA